MATPDEYENREQEAAATFSSIFSFIGKLTPLLSLMLALLMYIYTRDSGQTRADIVEIKLKQDKIIELYQASAIENATLKTKMEAYNARFDALEANNATLTAQMQQMQRDLMRVAR